MLYDCKKTVMRYELASELNVLSRRLLRISEYGRRTFDFTINVLRDALDGGRRPFPRLPDLHNRHESVSETDRRYVDWAVSQARKQSTAADTTVFDFIHEVLLLWNLDGPEEYEELVVAFVMKFQQYTGPVMAKGMEDTALYIYNRLVSLNEVGGSPSGSGSRYRRSTT